MMKCSRGTLTALAAKTLLILFLALGVSACASRANHAKSTQNLQRSISAYNDAFEGKRSESAEAFVQRDIMEIFKKKYSKIKKQVIFDEIEPMKTEYFKDGVAVKQSDSGPQEDFNQAVMTVRYSVVISPSNRVKNITVKQRWNREGDTWTVVPDLEPFSK